MQRQNMLKVIGVKRNNQIRGYLSTPRKEKLASVVQFWKRHPEFTVEDLEQMFKMDLFTLKIGV